MNTRRTYHLMSALAIGAAALIAASNSHAATWAFSHTDYMTGEVITGADQAIRLSAVPEPSEWALMPAGLELVGTLMQRRRASA